MDKNHRREGKWILAPLTDILTPKEGRICLESRYWKVTNNGNVLFFKEYSAPQCNSNKNIADYLCRGSDCPATTTVFVEFAFIPHHCIDYT
jgi:hypothetical protein